MACNQPAKPGIHNCRCSTDRTACWWHSLPTSSIRQTFREIVVTSYEDKKHPRGVDAETDKLRYAELLRLQDLARSAMLEPVAGTMPLDDRPQAMIEHFARIGQYGAKQ
jgi:hypothetical protein